MKIAMRRKTISKSSQQQIDASVEDATVEEEDSTVDQEDSTVDQGEAEIEEDEDAAVEGVEGEDDNQEEELVDQEDEVEEELVDQEGEVDEEGGEQEYEEVEGENEEDAGDDQEVEIAEDEGEEEGEGDADEDEATAENDELNKFPKPLNSAGDFSSIDNSELRSILEKSKINLYDGSQGLLFSRGPKYSDEKWPINCHICYESGLMNLKQLREHVRSTRHIRMLRWRPTDPKYKHSKAFRQPFEDDDPTLTPIFIYPGEVITEITPDLIDRIIGSENVPEENHSRMVGLSYGYKMNRFGKEIYDCILCRKNVPLKHFASQQHIDKYIEVHYRKTWKRLRNMLSARILGWGTGNLLIQQKYIRAAIRTIYKKVEAEKGARLAKFVSHRDFKINRVTYQNQALNKKHYDDKTIEITDDLLKETLKQIYEKFGPPKKYEKLSADEIIKKTQRPRRPLSLERSTRPRMVEGNAKAWDRYRRMIGANLDDLEEVYDRYLKDLESHPRYKKEWKKFWHNRADELEKKGIDPHKYDFNREWIPYWEKLLREFHAKDIVRQKFETKRKLKLPNDVRSPSPVRRPKRIAGRKRSPSPRSRQGRRRSRSRSRSPKRLRPDEPTTVVGVMRLVTALEDNLGSLGPQAVQLLSRAVLTEKSNPNPDSLLMENDFYIFFMTVKEKLKGQLQANILEPRKVNAVDRVIYQITVIINRFEEHRARHGNRSSQYQNNQSGGRDGAGSGGGAGGGGGARGIVRPNRYPNQYSGGSRGGVWHSGNYRMETGGDMPPNQNYQDRENNDNSMNFQQMSGGMGFGGDGGNNDSYVSQTGGNGYSGNRSGRMNRSMSPGPQNAGDSHRNQMSGGGGNSASFGRSDFDNGNGPPMYGGNNSGNFGNFGPSNAVGTEMGYNRGGGVRSGFSGDGNFNASYRTTDSQREHSNMGGGVGPNRGARYSDGSNKSESHISHNRNSMPLNRSGSDRDFNNPSNRDGNQMPFNRGPNRGDLDTMPQSPPFGAPNPPSWPTSGGYQGGSEVSRQQYSGGGMDSMKNSYNAGGSNMSRGGGGNHGGPSTEMRGGNHGGGGGMPSMGWNRTNQMNVQFNRGLNASGRY